MQLAFSFIALFPGEALGTLDKLYFCGIQMCHNGIILTLWHNVV